jgi:isocitrate dehydrogenase (NAD+)
LYSGLEHEIVKDVVTSIKVITRAASIRIARYAFEYAKRNGRKAVAAIHKANIMKLADGLFIRCCREVSQQFPEIAYKELIVDNASMQLVMRRYCFRPCGGIGWRPRDCARREYGRNARGI